VCAGAADAIEFYTKAFGAVETMRLPGKDGRLMHAAGPASAIAELAATKRTVHRVAAPDLMATSPFCARG